MGKKNKKGKKTALRKKVKKYENPKTEEDKVNPFELRINHQRYNILGRKSKNEKGMPGVSRNKALKKRKEFILKNKILTSKANYFIDKRIGEYDTNILKEDQIAARLAYEKRKKLKKSIYNLNDDDDELTHMGKPISMLETLDNPVSDSDDDDDDDDKLDANFVEEAHFGGFLKKKDSAEPPKTHREVIGDLILDSKRRKEERKLEREKNLDLTDKLDKDWKELMSTIGGSLKHANKVDDVSKNDPYDVIVQELKFEPRGIPANKLKTTEEIEEEEKQKLKKLEQERLHRMKDSNEDKKASDYVMSADSIYDGLQLEEEEDFVVPESSVPKDTEEQNVCDNEAEISDHSDLEYSQNDDDEEGDSDDMYSDLNSGSENEEEMEVESEKVLVSAITWLNSSDLPSKFSCVSTLEELLELVSIHSANEVSVILERMIKSNHPSLADGNRTKMETLFEVLLNYIDHICYKEGDCTQVASSLVPHLYSLAEMSPVNCASTFKAMLLKKWELLKKERRNSVTTSRFPHLSALIILKLCSILYSTSDFRHPVATIAMLYMGEVLSHKFFITYENIISRLFITSLFYEYVALSKRFVPEAINLLQTVLFCSSVKKPELAKLWRSSCQGDQNLLVLTEAEECEPEKISIKLLNNMLAESSGKLKISIIHNAVNQLLRYVNMYSSLPSAPELLSAVHHHLKCLPTECYPESLKSSIAQLSHQIAEVMSCKRSYLVFPMKKPKPLKLFEPDFDSNFVTKKNKLAKKIKLVKDLSKKCKREEKAIVREIRRDSQFLAHQQLQEKMEKDQERKDKVKRLLQDLCVQQGEIKAMNKKKK